MSASQSGQSAFWLSSQSPNTSSATAASCPRALHSSPNNSGASLERSRVNSFSTTEAVAVPMHASSTITTTAGATTTTTAPSGGTAASTSTSAVRRDPTQATMAYDTHTTVVDARQQGDERRAGNSMVAYRTPAALRPRLEAAPQQQPQRRQQQQQQTTPMTPPHVGGHPQSTFARESVPCVTDVSDISVPKTNIYQLRGLPFATTVDDVKALLAAVPEYKQLDVGFFETHECSGNAFVELYDDTYKDTLIALNNCRIAVPGEFRRTADGRKRERYLEVFPADIGRRESVLYNDAHSTPRRGPQRQPRPTAPAANPAALGLAMMNPQVDPMSGSLSFVPTRQVFLVEQPQHAPPQPQRSREGGAWLYVPRPSPVTIPEPRPALVASSNSSPSHFSENSPLSHSQDGTWPTYLMPTSQHQFSPPGAYYPQQPPQPPQPQPQPQQPQSYLPASAHPALLRLPASLVGEQAAPTLVRLHDGGRGASNTSTPLNLYQIVNSYTVQQQQQHQQHLSPPQQQPASPQLSQSQSQSQPSLYSIGDGSYVLLPAPAAQAPVQAGYYVATSPAPISQQPTFYYTGGGAAAR